MIAFASGMLLAAAGQLDSATIEIDLTGEAATVRAVYHISSARSDSVRFLLMRIAGQSVHLLRPAQPILSSDDGALALTIPAPSGGSTTTEIEYSVSGDLVRIPIFVPNAPTDPDRSSIALRVRGYVHRDAVRDACPRCSTVAAGRVPAPGTPPGVVRLPTGSASATQGAARGTRPAWARGRLGPAVRQTGRRRRWWRSWFCWERRCGRGATGVAGRSDSRR